MAMFDDLLNEDENPRTQPGQGPEDNPFADLMKDEPAESTPPAPVEEENPFASLMEDEAAEPVAKTAPADDNPFAGLDETPEEKERTVAGTIKDAGITAAKSVVGAGETAIGLIDLATPFVHEGKLLEKYAGYDPRASKQWLEGFYSEAQKSANKKLSEAEGFKDSLNTALSNPSTIAHAIGESIPLMLGGGAIGATLRAAKWFPTVSRVVSSAIGEGLVGAGLTAESMRQEDPTGVISTKKKLMSLGSGLGTGAFTLIGGRLSKAMKVDDIDTMLVKLAEKTSSETGERVTAKKAAEVAGNIVKGGISEGVFEELPQSVQEEMWMNAANDRPLLEGIGSAAAMGLLTGAAMGGGVNTFSIFKKGKEGPSVEKPKPGPISKALGEDVDNKEINLDLDATANKARAVGVVRLAELNEKSLTQELNAEETEELNLLTGQPTPMDLAVFYGVFVEKTAAGEEVEEKAGGVLGKVTQGQTEPIITEDEADVRDREKIEGQGRPEGKDEKGIKDIEPEIDQVDQEQKPADGEAARLLKEEAEILTGPGPAVEDQVPAEEPEAPVEEVPAEEAPAEKDADGRVVKEKEELAPQESAVAGQAVKTDLSEKEKESGKYKKAHLKAGPLNISIENPVGTTRSGTDAQGREWSQVLKSDYGDIKGAKGYDKDNFDIFIKKGFDTEKSPKGTVFVVNQHNQDGSFDEHKAVLGAANAEEAMRIYNSNYESGWTGGKSVIPMSMDHFNKWVMSGDPAKGPAVDPGENVTVKEKGLPNPAANRNDYYISTGRQGKYYTLRVQYNETVGRELKERDYLVASLGTQDYEKALEKAKRLTAEAGNSVLYAGEIDLLDKDTRGLSLKFGKYQGATIDNIYERDPGYLKWVHFNQRHRLTKESKARLDELMGQELAEEAKKIEDQKTERKAELAKKEEQREENIRKNSELARVLYEQGGGFASDMSAKLQDGDDLINDFSDRQRDIIRDIYAKRVGGRANSNKYKQAWSAFGVEFLREQTTAEAAPVEDKWVKQEAGSYVFGDGKVLIEKVFQQDIGHKWAVVINPEPDATGMYVAGMDVFEKYLDQPDTLKEAKARAKELLKPGKKAFKIEKAPKAKVGLEDVKAVFPGAQVAQVEGGYLVVTANGTLISIGLKERINVGITEVPVEYQDVVYLDDKGVLRNKQNNQEITPEGSFQRFGKNGIIALAKRAGKQTLSHESYHAAEDIVLTKEEIAVLEKQYGDSEKRAEAYEVWDGTDHTLFAKIRDFFARIANALGANIDMTESEARDIFNKIYSGEVWKRKFDQFGAGILNVGDVGNDIHYALDHLRWEADTNLDVFGTVNNRLGNELQMFERLFGPTEKAIMAPGILVGKKRPNKRTIKAHDMGLEIERVIKSGEYQKIMDDKRSDEKIAEELAKRQGVEPTYKKNKKGERKPTGKFKHYVDDINVLRGTGQILGDNSKAGRGVDFVLGTCQPTENCQVCYAATAFFRMSHVRKSMRNTFRIKTDPKGFAADVVAEAKKIKINKMPFLRLQGSGDLTSTEQIESYNEMARLLDRPIQIFSRHHSNLKKLKSTKNAPFIKMGSVDNTLISEYGMGKLSGNLKDHGIANAILYTDKSEIPTLKKLHDKGAVGLILSASVKLHETLPAELQKLSCPCDAQERTHHGSCRQCVLSQAGCFTCFADKAVNQNGNVVRMGDKGSENAFPIINLANIKNFNMEKSYLEAFNYIMDSSITGIKNNIRAYKSTDKAKQKKGIVVKDLRAPDFTTILIKEGNPRGVDIERTSHLVREVPDPVADAELYIEELKAKKELAKDGTFYLPGGPIQPARAWREWQLQAAPGQLKPEVIETELGGPRRFRLDIEETTKTQNFKNWFGDWENNPDGASKVVDEDGKPLVVHHGGFGAPKITVFDKDYGGQTTGNNEHGAFHFTENREVAEDYSRQSFIRRFEDNPEALVDDEIITQEEFDRVEDEGGEWYGYVADLAESYTGTSDTFLNLRNPIVIDNKGEQLDIAYTDELSRQVANQDFSDEILDHIDFYFEEDLIEDNREEIEEYAREELGLEEGESIDDEDFEMYAREYLQEQGYEEEFDFPDGIIIRDMIDNIGDASYQVADQYIVFDPRQIKSIHNKGTFGDTGDIRFRLSSEQDPFFSQLEKSIPQFRKKFPNGTKAQSVIAWAGNVAKKAELAASGLMTFLGAKKATEKVTADDLESFLIANETELEDVMLGDPDYISSEAWDIAEQRYDEMADRGYRNLPDTEMLALEAQEEMGKGGTFFEEYTVPGGENYREMFVTAPDHNTGTFFQWLKTIGRDAAGHTERTKLFERYQKEIMPARKNWRDGHSEYHDIENPVVRIRFNERADSDGRKILFIEEMQGPSKDGQEWMPSYLKDNIYQIGTKRVLAYAKDNGFDGISWTSGKMQADRYDLSKHIDTVKYKEHDDGTFFTEATKDGKSVFGDLSAERKKLESYYGKELAEKMTKGVGKETADGYKVLSGFDLKVGGEGLKRLYDQDLGNMFKAYGKNNVGSTRIATATPLKKEIEGWETVKKFDTEVPYIPVTKKTPASYPKFSLDVGTKVIDNLNELSDNESERSDSGYNVFRGNGVRIDPINGARTADESQEAKDKIGRITRAVAERFQGALLEGTYIPVNVSPATKQLSESIAKAFGLKVDYFGSISAAPSAAIDGDTVFINTDSGLPPSTMVGQAIAYHLANTKKKSFSNFIFQLIDRGLFDGDVFQDYVDAKEKAPWMNFNQLNRDQIETHFAVDMLGDFIGDNITNDQFWFALKESGLKLEGLDYVPSLLTDMYKAADKKNGPVSNLNSDRYFKKPDLVRKAVAQLLVQGSGNLWKPGVNFGGITNPATTGGVGYSGGMKFSIKEVFNSQRDRVSRIEEKYSIKDRLGQVYTYLADRLYPAQRLQKILGEQHEKADYLLAERLRGKVTANEVSVFHEERVLPIIQHLVDSGLSITEMEELAYAMHAQEANIHLRRVNARMTVDKMKNLFTEKQWEEIAEKLFEIDNDVTGDTRFRNEKRDAYIDLLDETFGRIDEIRSDIETRAAILRSREFTEEEIAKGTPEFLWNRLNNAYDRLTRLEQQRDSWNNKKDRLSGITDEEAQTIKDKWAGDPRYDANLAAVKMMSDINADKLKILYEAGEMTQGEYEAIDQAYDHYVPLYRDGMEDGKAATGRLTGPLGKPVKVRAGSLKEVVNIFGHTVDNYQSAVVRKHKLEAAATLYRMVLGNPDPDKWTLDAVPKRSTMDDDGNIRLYPDMEEKSNELYIKIDGERKLLTVNKEDKSMMEFLAAVKETDAPMGGVMQGLYKINRFLAALNTSFNPEFIISNFVRDIQTAVVHMEDTEAQGLQKRALKRVPAMVKAIYLAENDKDAGADGESYKSFSAEGGKIGWMQGYENVEQLAKDLEDEYRNLEPGHPLVKGRKKLMKLIGSSNTAVENGVRLALYAELTGPNAPAGMTKKKAAKIVSDLTVDFTRRGKVGSQVNALYMFANAGIQGNVRMIKAMMRSGKVRKIAGGIVSLGFSAYWLGMWMGGDDEDGESYYEKLKRTNPSVFERNIVIMVPGGKGEIAAKIPMPYLYNSLFVLGNEMAGSLANSMYNRDYDHTAGAARAMSALLNSANPLQAATLLQTLTPTIIDPITQVAENKAWHGGDLFPGRSPYGGPPKPDSERYFKSVNPILKSTAKAVNKLTGGDEFEPGLIDVSPETLEMMIETYTGGAGRFVKDTLFLPVNIASGELEVRQVPFARRVLTSMPKSADSRIYRENVNKVELFNKRFKAADAYDKINLREDDLYPLRLIMTLTERRVKKLKERKRAYEDKDKNDPRIKEIEERLDEIYLKFNTRYNKATRR